MTRFQLVIAGGGLAAARAIKSYRDAGGGGRIALLAKESGVAERAVIVGGGFIGMEVAASLRRLGLAVTLIHMGPGLFDQLGSAELSEELLAFYREHGVDVLLEEAVTRFDGGDPLEYVETTSGLCVEADIAVVGVGVVPNVDFL